MDFSELVEVVTEEIKAFRNASDPKAHLLGRIDALYETYIRPIDLPGPDAIVDRFLKRSILDTVAFLYDKIDASLSSDEDTPVWPAMPKDGE